MTQSIASLPMYDFPDARAATNAWWTGLAGHLTRQGIQDVPRFLLHRDDLIEQWQNPDLLISQTCGYILTHHLAGHAQAVATPCYSAPGCAGASYASVILVRDGHPGTSLADFRRSRAVYSRIYSHAGYNIFRSMIAPLAQGKAFFSTVSASGSHLDSIAKLASDKADIATIDCIVYAFVMRHRPHLLAGTRSIGYSPAAPTPPYIISAACVDNAERVRSALKAAIADPALANARAALFLADFADPGHAATDTIDKIEKKAMGLGYPRLL